jgi:hypothetical protein
MCEEDRGSEKPVRAAREFYGALKRNAKRRTLLYTVVMLKVRHAN